ncbi:MAG: hypothetical protein J6V25_06845 [Oscillospiraceae bacterium]|nr:hypothetical protein [Oscillospiraceae bacterium]
MKKDMIFAPVLLLIGIALFALKATGMTAHIAISVVGIVVLAAYTAATRKQWKIPALEIAMRACYGIALITGVVVMKGVAAAAIVHKISAAAFVILLAVLFVKKLSEKKA